VTDNLGREAVGRRSDKISLPVEHEHIIALKLDDDSILYIGEVIAAIESGERLHMQGELIEVVSCSKCGAFPYLYAPLPKEA
jgi:hypothetical protein